MFKHAIKSAHDYKESPDPDDFFAQCNALLGEENLGALDDFDQ